jgi:fructosamine-3-kinase
MTLWRQIATHISEASGAPFAPEPPQPVAGGCISRAFKLSHQDHHYFIKLNQATQIEMFAAEAAGLAEIAQTHTLRTARPLCHGIAKNQAYLVMEYIQLGRPQARGMAQAGLQLAAMHRTRQGQYGWQQDNTIGSTPQPNGPDDDWGRFWKRQRLGFQLQLAANNGYGGRLQDRGQRLLEQTVTLIDHSPIPSLLHGDLWSGNLAYDLDGAPVIHDPAVYYGDREADIAMTELFGGFSPDFYAAYNSAWPLDSGYEVRKELYNLYHILNHLNLFGDSYLGQAQGMIDRLLSACH